MSGSESATQASCEIGMQEGRANFDEYDYRIQRVKACYLNLSKVDDEDFTISLVEDTAIPTLIVWENNVYAMSISKELFDAFPHFYAFSSGQDAATQVLVLTGTEVKFLPKNLSVVLPELVDVRISKTAVTAIGESHFKGLSKVKFLNLERNQIEYVPNNAFTDLASLERLYLTKNRIQYIGKLAFSALSSLKKLKLGENQIRFLHPEIFKSLVNLEELKLYANDIVSLNEHIFEHLSRLDYISIVRNKLTKIPRNLFANNTRLTRINLYQNQIKFIDAQMFDHLLRLKHVYLVKNQCVDKNFIDMDDFNALKNHLKENCASE